MDRMYGIFEFVINCARISFGVLVVVGLTKLAWIILMAPVKY